jgi:peptidoglycan hydrolase-like protein with peptidoglycan-binding domain
LEKTQKAVKAFQLSNRLPPSGVVDQKMWKAISKAISKIPKDKSQNTKVKQDVVKSDIIKTRVAVKSLNVSDQVKKQLKYLSDNNFLADKKFTILDDKLSKVHTFLPGYQLGNTYNVITGQAKGDDLKTKTLGDWLKSNWTTVAAKYFKNL